MLQQMAATVINAVSSRYLIEVIPQIRDQLLGRTRRIPSITQWDSSYLLFILDLNWIEEEELYTVADYMEGTKRRSRSNSAPIPRALEVFARKMDSEIGSSNTTSTSYTPALAVSPRRKISISGSVAGSQSRSEISASPPMKNYTDAAFIETSPRNNGDSDQQNPTTTNTGTDKLSATRAASSPIILQKRLTSSRLIFADSPLPSPIPVEKRTTPSRYLPDAATSTPPPTRPPISAVFSQPQGEVSTFAQHGLHVLPTPPLSLYTKR